MSSDITSRKCTVTRSLRDSCPFDEDRNGAEQLTGGIAAGLAAMFEALDYVVIEKSA
jgi:hypothetical protein